MAKNLRIPTTQTDSETLLAQTQEVYRLELRLANGLRFEGIADVGEALERSVLQGILSGGELFAIATTLAGARTLRRTIDNQPDLPVLNDLVAELRTYPELEQEIYRCIDDNGDVTDRANPKLAGIREQQRHLRDRIHGLLQRIMQRKANAIQEPLITQRDGRFVLPVKAPQKDAIPGIVHDTSMSGATLYVEPQPTVNLNNQLRQLQRQEEREEEAVRQALTEQVAAVKSDLERLLAIVTTIDLATARARYSLWLGANPPRFIDFGVPIFDLVDPLSGNRPQSQVVRLSAHDEDPNPKSEPVVLRQLRHPLLVWQQQHEQGMPVVPIDLIIQPQIRVVAITGPNTGGKTVTLKTLGLAVLMAKVGLFVPAREPVELPWFEQILADIGDEQSLEQSLSTFSGHIRRISRILAALGNGSQESGVGSWELGVGSQESGVEIQNSKSKIQNPKFKAASLVLLDEVGAGTDPTEGSALAIALLRYLADHALLTVATTHFGELKALKYEDDRFENASVEFDDVTLSPTYRLLWGIPGRSNALTIARRLGLDAAIVQQAQSYVGGPSEDVNQVIAGLEAQRRRQETKAQEASQLLEQAERLHQEVARKAQMLKEREQQLQVQQEQAVQQAISAAKGEIAKVIRQLQQGPVTAQEAQQATEAVNQIADRRLPSRQQAAKPKPVGFLPQVGDRIRIPRLGQTAEVLTAPDSDGELTVRFGLMKMTVSLEDVESLQGEKAVSSQRFAAKQESGGRSQEVGVRSQEEKQKGQNPAPVAAPLPVIRTERNTIDIRGSRVADAEPVLEKAIVQAQDRTVWIIHGQGTGKLRQGVQEFLQQHPQVERFELASREEGGSGVTIAYLIM